jgi:hypothetical protein
MPMHRINHPTSEEGRQAQPYFLITIDTEGDNYWSRPQGTSAANAYFIHRFQQLCETYGLKPTYLTSYEMAKCDVFRDFGRDLLQRGAAEIGMHLHAWNTPPLLPLTPNDEFTQPYLIEYAEPIMREKITTMTSLLEDTFGVRMVSHRAGRWSLNEIYACILVEKGYLVDCSVTPHISWQQHRGDPAQYGGSDYTAFPEQAYYLDLNALGRSGESSLLEIPTTTKALGNPLLDTLRRHLPERSLRGRVFRTFFPAFRWFRPTGTNLAHLMDFLLRERASVRHQPAGRRLGYLQLVLHSSELMPGGSPTFPTARHIEWLYRDLERLFAAARPWYQGATLQEYAQAYRQHALRQSLPDISHSPSR